jgi:hypothetical protein
LQELIWFSIPGFTIVAAIVAVWPSLTIMQTSPSTDVISTPKVALLVVLVPVVGFIVHQIFRLIFEKWGGFARKSRKVLHHISKVLAPRENIAVPDLKRAFLVWETVFYSDKFPAPFREHDRRSWHFIISFWSISFSAVIAILICGVGYLYTSPNYLLLGVITVSELLIGLIFYFKGMSTYQSLIDQEIAVVFDNEEIFLTTIKKLKDMK